MPSRIGTLNEKPLHAALKDWYSKEGDQLEVRVDGYFVDIVRGTLLIEIQTGSFAAVRRKIEKLLKKHRVRLVYPIAGEKWILKLPKNRRSKAARRRSPKRGAIEDVFNELVSIPTLLAHRRFSMEVVLTREEEVRRYDGKLAWRRRGWVIDERRLIDVMDSRLFRNPGDMVRLIPSGIEEPFRTADLASALDRPLWSAQKMVYCLREMGAITRVGKSGNWITYVTRAADHVKRKT